MIFKGTCFISSKINTRVVIVVLSYFNVSLTNLGNLLSNWVRLRYKTSTSPPASPLANSLDQSDTERDCLNKNNINEQTYENSGATINGLLTNPLYLFAVYGLWTIKTTPQNVQNSSRTSSRRRVPSLPSFEHLHGVIFLVHKKAKHKEERKMRFGFYSNVEKLWAEILILWETLTTERKLTQYASSISCAFCFSFTDPLKEFFVWHISLNVQIKICYFLSLDSTN